MATSSRPPDTKKQGRRPKLYIDKKDSALALAIDIADLQEEKSKGKVDKYHKQAQVTAARTEHKSRPSSQSKLNEVKASIKAEAARAKKAKVKERKHAHEANTELQVKNKADGKRSAGDAPARKRVAFA